jgi:hypothetical protein
VLDLLDEAHAQVAITILQADMTWPTHVDKVPDDAKPPYALVYPVVGWPDGDPDESLDGRTRRCETRWYIHCAGSTDQSARSVSGRVRQLLLNVRPTIVGRDCGLISQDVPPTLMPNEATGVLVVDLMSVYLLVSVG